MQTNHTPHQTFAAYPSVHARMPKDQDMFDYAALDVYLMPETEEFMEILPYEDDVMVDVPEFNAAVREAVDRRILADDPLPTTYGA